MRQINLINDGNDLEVLFHRQVYVRDRLRLDSLGRVYNQ